MVTSTREHLYDLKSLETFAYHDEQGKDQGINGLKYSINLIKYLLELLIF